MIDRDRKAPEPLPVNQASAGKLLSKARASWDLSIKDVAEHLNLGVDTIQALEQDDYAKLPGYTFVKGYVRSYAKLLKLDEEEVLRAVDLEETIPEVPPAMSGTGVKSRAGMKRKKSGGRFLKVLFSLILLGVLVLFAASLLSKINMHELAAMLKLPVSENADSGNENGNEITFPAGGDQNKPKEALIRIEE